MVNFFGEDEEEELGPLPVDPMAQQAPVAQAEMNPQVKDYLMEKFQLGGQDRIAAALAGLGAGFQGRDSMAAVQNSLGNAQKQKVQEYELGKQVSSEAEDNDPNSESSKIAQTTAKEMGYPGDVSKITAAKFKAFSPNFSKIMDARMRDADRKAMREEQRFQHGIKIDEKKERNLEQDMQKLSKDVSGTQEMLGALDEVEGKLGAPLDSFSKDKKSGNLQKNGKDVDLPGVSVPGFGRVTAYSGEARDLNSAASRVFNATLKDRSGGTVTDNEMERLKREFNEGKYNNEAELVEALQRYKRQTQLVLKNREAAYNPDVVARYTEQGGRTSKTMPKQAAGKEIVKTQTNQKTGQKRIVYSDGSVEVIDNVAGR